MSSSTNFNHVHAKCKIIRGKSIVIIIFSYELLIIIIDRYNANLHSVKPTGILALYCSSAFELEIMCVIDLPPQTWHDKIVFFFFRFKLKRLSRYERVATKLVIYSYNYNGRL